MHRHTPCKGVGGVMHPRDVSSCPQRLGGLIHQQDGMGDLPKSAHGGDPLLYCPPVTHPPSKITRKLTQVSIRTPPRHTRTPTNKVAYLHTCSIVNMFTDCCMYVSGLWELLYVWTCGTTCFRAATARPTPWDALRASVYLRALPLDVRAQVCRVFVGVHRFIMYVYDMYT